jgi:gliding motility-associated-like protein
VFQEYNLSLYRNMKKLSLLFFAFLFAGMMQAEAQLNIDTTATLTELIQEIVGPSVIVNTLNSDCPPSALATFTNGSSTDLGMNSGILLTTGAAIEVNGPSSALLTQNHTGTSSHDLMSLLAVIAGVAEPDMYDGCHVEFDFTPYCDTFRLQYIFGSEEYPDYVNSGFNDAAGIFITGPNPAGGTYSNMNMAVLPGTSTPATINTINSSTNAQYFIDNSAGSTIAYNGFTTPIISALPVVPCSTYHCIAGIGDAIDRNYDSGLFITPMTPACPMAVMQVSPGSAICAGKSATLSASGMLSYTWSPAAGLSTTTGASVIAAPAVTTTYTVTGSSGSCYNPSATITVTVDPSPVASFTPSSVGGAVPLIVNFTNNSTGAISYSWNLGNSISAAPNPSAVYTDAGIYIVMLVAGNAAGCTDTAYCTITADAFSDISIPNVFSPNGDNTNDMFTVTSTGLHKFHCEIYNRWGIRLFAWDDPASGWNGITENGSPAPEGTYYYTIIVTGADGKAYDYHGFVTLLRK